MLTSDCLEKWTHHQKKISESDWLIPINLSVGCVCLACNLVVAMALLVRVARGEGSCLGPGTGRTLHPNGLAHIFMFFIIFHWVPPSRSACASSHPTLGHHCSRSPPHSAVNRAGKRWTSRRKRRCILFGAELAVQTVNTVSGVGGGGVMRYRHAWHGVARGGVAGCGCVVPVAATETASLPVSLNGAPSTHTHIHTTAATHRPTTLRRSSMWRPTPWRWPSRAAGSWCRCTCLAPCDGPAGTL